VDQVKALDPPGCFLEQETSNGPFTIARDGDVYANVFLAHIDLLAESE
jgi:hypothetical protein